jgi:hypothetical protein
MEENKITMFVTKYLWTRGILEFRGEMRDFLGPSETRFMVVDPSLKEGRHAFKVGLEAFPDRADAVKRAEWLRTRKIAKLEKELARVRETAF